MKQIKFLAILVLVLPLLVFNACKKDETPPEPTKTELLTGSNWTGIRAYYYEDNQLISTEIINEDVFDFQSNGKGIYYYQNAVDGTFDWIFGSNQTQLIMDFGNNDIWVTTIETLTSTSVIISDTATYNGVLARDEYHFGK